MSFHDDRDYFSSSSFSPADKPISHNQALVQYDDNDSYEDTHSPPQHSLTNNNNNNESVASEEMQNATKHQVEAIKSDSSTTTSPESQYDGGYVSGSCENNTGVAYEPVIDKEIAAFEDDQTIGNLKSYGCKNKCDPALQEKVVQMYNYMEKSGTGFTKFIRERKEFKNPSIYEKLIKHLGIDERGSNFQQNSITLPKLDAKFNYANLAKEQMDFWKSSDKSEA